MRDNMYDNFRKLESRVFESISKTDLIKIRDILSSIDEPTLVSGVGGSSVVSNFLSKVLAVKNDIICQSVTPRDLIYQNLCGYKNVIACSYSGKNLGVDVAFNNDLKKYLLSKNIIEGVENINYIVGEDDHSFISLSSTLIPMTMALLYYCDNDISLIEDILSSTMNFQIGEGNVYEVLTGYETNTASKFIESTFVESGIGLPIIHDKYEYCHGRTTLNYYLNNNLIFLNCNKEVDKLHEQGVKEYYKNIIQISKKYEDDIINDYYFTYMCMLLCKAIAEKHEKDLSIVKYSPLVKKLYYYKGEL